MKKAIIYIVLTFLTVLTNCKSSTDPTETQHTDKPENQEDFSIPINYDFDNLKLHLNSAIDDTTSTIEWSWDYMTSSNSVPDTIGIDHFMNISQPSFSYNGDRTSPCLSVTTERKKITRFVAAIIFQLPDHKPASLESLFDSLTKIEVLQADDVRQSVIENHRYSALYDHYEESVELILAEDDSPFDRIIYEIKITDHDENPRAW